jgi:hypothetical protein
MLPRASGGVLLFGIVIKAYFHVFRSLIIEVEYGIMFLEILVDLIYKE